MTDLFEEFLAFVSCNKIDNNIINVSISQTLKSQNKKYVGFQIRRGNKDNLGIIFIITPLKRILRSTIRTVSSRRF